MPEFIRLVGKTQHGKQRVKQQGDRWEVLDRAPTLIGRLQDGPWLWITNGNGIRRWVHEHDDSDFIIHNQ